MSTGSVMALNNRQVFGPIASDISRYTEAESPRPHSYEPPPLVVMVTLLARLRLNKRELVYEQLLAV